MDNSRQVHSELFKSAACNDTDDKIFLLSSKEWMTSAYGFGADDDKANGLGERSPRQRFSTDYAKACYADIYKYSGWGCPFATRSAGYNTNGKYTTYCVIDIVSFDGAILYDYRTSGDPANGWTSPSHFGDVVPALCVNKGDIKAAN